MPFIDLMPKIYVFKVNFTLRRSVVENFRINFGHWSDSESIAREETTTMTMKVEAATSSSIKNSREKQQALNKQKKCENSLIYVCVGKIRRYILFFILPKFIYILYSCRHVCFFFVKISLKTNL